MPTKEPYRVEKTGASAQVVKQIDLSRCCGAHYRKVWSTTDPTKLEDRCTHCGEVCEIQWFGVAAKRVIEAGLSSAAAFSAGLEQGKGVVKEVVEAAQHYSKVCPADPDTTAAFEEAGERLALAINDFLTPTPDARPDQVR